MELGVQSLSVKAVLQREGGTLFCHWARAYGKGQGEEGEESGSGMHLEKYEEGWQRIRPKCELGGKGLTKNEESNQALEVGWVAKETTWRIGV